MTRIAACLAAALLGCTSTEVRTPGSNQGASDRNRSSESFDARPVTVEPQDSARDADPGGVDSATAQPGLPVREGADQRSDAPLWVPQRGDFVLRDKETGTLWNLRGQAYSGDLENAQLAQVAAYSVFWFSWSTAHHGGEVWNRSERNEPGPIEPDASGACDVPCNELRSGGPAPDGIPALDYQGRWNRPKAQEMVAAESSKAAYLDDADLVVGVYLDGEARAYPYPVLNWHEILIDAISGREYNVTYCPLTASAIVIPADQGKPDPLHLFVSGRLFNDNLTMFERGVSQDDVTFWNQVLLRGISGPRKGERLAIWPATETAWGRWKQIHPDTRVASSDTGYSRDYGTNPYTSLQAPTAGTLGSVRPRWEPTYDTKRKVLAIDGPETSRAYAYQEMRAKGDRVVINDTLDGSSLLVVYDAEHRMAVPFSRDLGGRTLTFEGVTAP